MSRKVSVIFTALLLFLTIQLTLQGFFRQRAILTDKSPPPQPPIKNDRKVIMMLVDALREDFVDLDALATSHQRITEDNPDYYKGQKLTIFR